MNEIDDNIRNENSDLMNQVIILGTLVLLTILAPALLHSNQYEFIVMRFDIGLLEASYFDSVLYASYLIAGILTAILSNQIGKRKIFILLGSLGSSVFYLGMALVPTTNYILLLIFRFIQGSFTVLCWQTLMTIVLDLSSAQNRGKNMGIFGMFMAAAMGAGPVLGGILAGIGDFAPYYTASLLGIVVFLIALFLLSEPQQLKAKPSFVENLEVVVRRPRLIIPGIFNFVDRFHIGFILFILPLFLPIVLHVEPELRGMVLGLFALPFILLQYPVGRWSDRIGRYKPLIFGSISCGIILAFMGLLGSLGLIVLIIAFILLGICNGFTGPPAMALVGDIVEADENATGMGFFNLLGNIGIILGPIVGGFLVYSETTSAFVVAFAVAGLIEFVSLAGIMLLILFIFNKNPLTSKPIMEE